MSTENLLINKLKAATDLGITMAAYFNDLKTADEHVDQKIAWCTSVGPAELLYAMGFKVYFPENHSAMIGASKQAANHIPSAVAQGYSPEICSYLTSDIGAYINHWTPLEKYGFQLIPKPDVLVYNTNQCRDVADWFSYFGREYNVPVLGIQTPLNIGIVTDSITACVTEQIKTLIPALEQISGSAFDIDRYKDCLRLSLLACKLWRESLETATQIPSPFNFFDAVIHMAPIVVMRGTQAALDYYSILLNELRQRIADGISAVPEERYRIYWDGMPLWFSLSTLAKKLASLNISVVASTYCNSWVFDLLNPEDPFNSTAQAYSNLFIVRSEEEKSKRLKQLFKQFKIDGIIYHDSKTCPRNSNTRYGMHQRLFQDTSIPFLEIAGDLNDARCFNLEHTEIALETFCNQLESRKFTCV